MAVKHERRRLQTIRALLLFAVFNGCLILAGLFLYVKWAEYSGHDVIPILVKNNIMKQLFVDNEFLEFERILLNGQNRTFLTTWDYDSGVALSLDMYSSQEMYGARKYAYRPNTGIYNAVVWSGLSRYGLGLVATPQMRGALNRVTLLHKAYFETDSYGFKKTEFAWSPGSPTIFFLGDSFTEGLWVTSQQTFVNQVGVKLRESMNSITPINLGVNGYSALEMDWMLENYAPIFHPLIVVANLFPNDVHVNYYSVIKGEGIPEANYEEMFFYLQRMKDYCKANGIALVISVIPAKEQFTMLKGFSAFHLRVNEWCNSHGVRCLDPRSFFENAVADRVYFSWDPHLSPYGHSVYAEYLIPYLASLLSSTYTTTER